LSGVWVNKSGDSMTGDLSMLTTGTNTVLTVAGGGVNLNASIKLKESALDRWSILFEGLQNDLHIWNNAYDYSMMEFGLVQGRTYVHTDFAVQPSAFYDISDSTFFANVSNKKITIENLTGTSDSYVAANAQGELFRDDTFKVNMIYGGMYGYNDTGYLITIPTFGEYYNITGLTCGYINGFTCNATAGTLTVQIPGIYKIDFMVAVEAALSNGLYGIGISKNYANLETQMRCYDRAWLTSNEVYNSGGSCFLNLSVGDTINFMIDDEVNPARAINWQTIQFTTLKVGN
jgi:hypothetical protein